ncbi:MAG: hypothetical protein SFU98_03835 [Leptospiraceae bacterium]|nr:hypothetical protein [Leptospiraceae bacterium]
MQRKRFDEIIIVLLISLLFILVPYKIDSSFFFNDDYQTEYLPAFLDIGKLLLEQKLPFRSELIWFGGYYLGEFQFSVLNPISLALYAILRVLFEQGIELHLLATFFSGIHIIILSFGIYQFGKSLFFNKTECLLLVVLVLSNGCLLFWYEINYITGLVSLAWFTWFLSTLRNFSKTPFQFVFFFYLVISSGWPFGIVACLVSLGIYFFILINQKQYKQVLLLVFLGITSGLISLLPILPMLEYQSQTLRIVNKNPISFNWFLGIKSLLFLSFPSPGIYRNWNGVITKISTPFVFSSFIFIPTIICFFLTNKNNFFINKFSLFLGISCFCLTIFSFLPLDLLLRFYFRMLPFAAIFQSCISILILRKIELNKFHLIFILYSLACTIYSIIQYPEKKIFFISFLCIVILFVLLTQLTKKTFFWILLCIASSILMLYHFHKSDIFGRFEIQKKKSSDTIARSIYLLCGHQENLYFTNHLGNLNLYHSIKSVNGYSPMIPRLLTYIFNFAHNSVSYDCNFDRYLMTIYKNQNILDFSNIGIVHIPNERIFKDKYLENGWVLKEGNETHLTFEKKRDSERLLKEISFMDQNIILKEYSRNLLSHHYTFKNISDSEGFVVISLPQISTLVLSKSNKFEYINLRNLFPVIKIQPYSIASFEVSFFTKAIQIAIYCFITGILLLFNVRLIKKLLKLS